MKDVGLNRNILLCAGLGLLVLAGCEQKHAGPQAAGDTASGYLTPPTLGDVSRLADGSVHLMGQAPADAVVRLRSPDGGSATAQAGAEGAWSLDLPPSATPRLYAFDAAKGAQTVRSEGALAVMPAPAAPALVLRAGYAALPSGLAANQTLRLTSLDFDGGGAAAGGVAPPHARVRLSMDGAVLGVAEAGADGRFAILAVDPGKGVGSGSHLMRVETQQGLSIERTVQIAQPALPADKPFEAHRVDDGWAVSWRLPGGGAQTSLVFDDAVSQGPPAGAPR